MNTCKIFGTKVHEKPEFSKNSFKYLMGKSLPHPPAPSPQERGSERSKTAEGQSARHPSPVERGRG